MSRSNILFLLVGALIIVVAVMGAVADYLNGGRLGAGQRIHRDREWEEVRSSQGSPIEATFDRPFAYGLPARRTAMAMTPTSAPSMAPSINPVAKIKNLTLFLGRLSLVKNWFN